MWPNVATASQTSSLPDPALHLGLVRLQVKRFKACDRWIPADDFYSAGLVGLCEAARRYDPARGTTFATYAMHWIKG
jgi:DNA-directed RNA polymerase specialized sigma subunit